MTNPNGLPGPGTATASAFRNIFTSVEGRMRKPGGVIVQGAKSRDWGNTGYLDTLRAGTLLGKVTSSGKYAPSILGVIEVYSSGGTEITVTAAQAVEIERRIGASGSAGDIVCVGAPTATGTVVATDVTYSAINTTTGVITVTNLAVNKAAGSIITAGDGSETILGIMGKEDGLKVTEDVGTSINVQCPEFIIGGQVDASELIGWPPAADTTLIAYIKAALRTAGYAYTFDDVF